MAKIKLFTDSNVDLPQEILDKMDVAILPMNIAIEDKSYLDKLEISSDDVLKYAKREKKTPKTASPTIEKTLEILSTMDKDDYAIFFLISSKVSSSTHMIVRNAIDYMDLGDRVEIVDTKSLSGGTGLLLLEAYKGINLGMDYYQLIDYLNEKVHKLHTGFVIDSLDYLYYGGRCSQMDLLFTSKLKIRPLINLVDGEMQVVKKYRGNLNKVIKKYYGEMEKQLQNIDPTCIVVSHTKMEEPLILESLINSIENLNHFEQVIVTDASATITSHGGPNTIGLFYYMN